MVARRPCPRASASRLHGDRRRQDLDAQLAKADATIAAIQANKALLLGPYVSVTSDALNGVRGPHILATDDNVPSGGALTGLGNDVSGGSDVGSGSDRGWAGGDYHTP